jgi:hypothetical protein
VFTGELITTDGDTGEVLAGVEQMMDGVHVSIDRYFPSTAVIEEGQSVSWVIGEQNIVAHSVTYPYRGWEEQNLFYTDAVGNPMLEITGVLAVPTLENGGEWNVDADYNHSGIIFPGPSFTLRYTEPGVYPYADLFEPGMDRHSRGHGRVR